MPSLRDFCAERSGNFGMLTALLLVPLIGAIGMALDFSHAISLRTELMGVADAAAIGAISENSAGFKAAKSMKNDGEIDVAQTDGKKLFLAHRAGQIAADISEVGLQVSMKVAKKNGAINSVATFSADVPTTFLRIFGKETIAISGSASAAYGAEIKSFTNFYMLLDNTPSMGIAATRAEMTKMEALTGANGGRACALACHTGYYDRNGKFNESSNTYNIARANGITLRIDVVAKAVEALINKVKSEMSSSADQYKVAAYSFGKYALEPGYRIDKISSLTVDMASASKATSDVGLMTTDHDHFNQNALTSFETSLAAIGKEISGTGGAGTSAADPQKIVYFITDGVNDALKLGGSCGGSWYEDKGRCLEPMDVKNCTALKDRGIKLAILYTTYIPLDGDHIWETYMSKVFASKIASQLKACASEDLFFEVGPEDDMQDAVMHLFVKAASGATGLRLTQ